MAPASHTLLFSGGGTAGHLAPGFALAHALEAGGQRCFFATPGEAVEENWFRDRALPRKVHARRLPRSPTSALTFPFHLMRGVWQARRLMRREGVHGVVALGGWPCAPAVLAARFSGRPLFFLVPDAVPGVLVKRFARWADRLYLANDAARPLLEPHAGIHVSGPLLRASVQRGTRDPTRFGLEADRRTLLVTGGSLGAAGLNRRLLDGLEQALAARPELRDRVQVLHSAGRDHAEVRARYPALGIPHHVSPYLDDMGSAYASADLVVARAGASTCAELELLARPTIFVPYPHHADRQQFLNAEPLVRRGAARIIEEAELTPSAVEASVLALLLDEAACAEMRAAAATGQSDAVASVAADLIRFMDEKRSVNQEV